MPGNEREKYYDFLDIKTDAKGCCDGDLGIYLAPGAFDVRLYANDPIDFKIVLYRDFFEFTVQQPAQRACESRPPRFALGIGGIPASLAGAWLPWKS